MLIGRDWIVRHVPHQAAMCLIDEVTAWDAQAVHCRTRTHASRDNPLRAEGRLGAICGVEYAAQAVAIHQAILASDQTPGAMSAGPVQGYLAAVRQIETFAESLDALPGPLEISASRYAATDGGAIYDFVVRHDGLTLQKGRITLKVAGASGDRNGASR